MNKKFILSLLTVMLISGFSVVFAYDSSELNKRLISCIPTKDFNAGGTTVYQISGLTGQICIYKIQYFGIANKPDLICKVPYSRMREMTSFNPITIQKLRSQYCIVSLKQSANKPKGIYF